MLKQQEVLCFIPEVLPFIKQECFVHMHSSVREAINREGLTYEAIESGTYTRKNVEDARKVIRAIEDDYDCLSAGVQGNGSWRKLGLSVSNDYPSATDNIEVRSPNIDVLDNNVGNVFPALELLEGIVTAATPQEAQDFLDTHPEYQEYKENK